MISNDYARTMAAYNRWQNTSLYQAASHLSNAQRREDRGTFFGSIHATLSHLVWADKIWLSRFDGREAPRVATIPESVEECPEWAGMRRERGELDDEILQWAAGLAPEALAGDLTWFSGGAGREITRPLWVVISHFFNHQTHHRGQVHAMLTAAGQKPDDTDLPLLPDG